MNPHDPRQILSALLGVAPIDLAVPCQILKVSPYERDPAVIDQAARACFARVRAAQHLVHAETMQWMMQVIADARNAMFKAAAALPPQGHFQRVPPPPSAPLPTPPQWASQPAVRPNPSAANPPASEPAEAAVVIRVPRPRRRSGVDMENVAGAIGGLLMCGLLVFGVGIFVKQWWRDINRVPKKPPFMSPIVEPMPDRAQVKQGGGKAASDEWGTKPSDSDQTNLGVQIVQPNDDQMAAARENLKRAMKLAGEGSFEEGLRLAKRASQVMPDESDGLMLMIKYVKQYPGLADDAQRALNGSSEVDLGEPWGKMQFVEQDADSITFFSKGKHEHFTLKKFKGLEGVRFRVTRDYLDRANNPTNDLIIGSYQFLMRVNERGEINIPESHGAAEQRFRKAIASGDPDSVENGTLMMKVLAFDSKN